MSDSKVAILSHPESAETDRHLQEIIALAGLESVVLSPDGAPLQTLARLEPTCVMSSAVALANFIDQQQTGWKDLFRGTHKGHLFVYGFCPEDKRIELARKISGDVISSIVGFDGSQPMYQVTPSRRDITQEFAGLSFGPINPRTDFGFVVREHTPGLSRFVSIADFPHFASLDLPSCRLFLSACTGIADILQESDDGFKPVDHFSKLVPPLMFLRHCFGKRCWHTPRKFARFIIDDPLLRKSYGFLRFDKLLESTADVDFGLSVAFIPWNYRRTDSSAAGLFRSSSPRLSLCIHGCDHTQDEFAIVDEAELNSRVRLAVRRMEHLAEQTTLPYENVMVFPNGAFSSKALAVLKSNNLLGAINFGAVPLDLTKGHHLRLADFLTPAVTHFHGFPLFMRRYPGEIANFAWDLFFNKPAFLFEHHEYFKEGYTRVRKMAEKLNSLHPDLQWTPLDHILSHAQLQSVVKDGVVLCRIFANSQVLENISNAPATFLVSKTESRIPLVEAVWVNGEAQRFEIHGNELSFQTIVPAHGSARVQIFYQNALPTSGRKTGRLYASRVFMRRHLSEFRDNVLARHDFLLRLANQLKAKIQ